MLDILQKIRKRLEYNIQKTKIFVDRAINVQMFWMLFMMIACGCWGIKDHFVIGNVAQTSLQELWTGKVFSNFRDSFKSGNLISECRTCTYYSPYTNYFSNLGLKDYQPTEDFYLKLK